MRPARVAVLTALVVAAKWVITFAQPDPVCNKALYDQAEVEDGRLVVHGTPVPYNGVRFGQSPQFQGHPTSSPPL
jgi:hypothetical protein